MVHRFPETLSLVAHLQADYEQKMRALGKPIPKYDDMEEGLPEEFKGKGITIVAATSAAKPQKAPAAPRKEGTLKVTSKAEIAREIMRNTKDKGIPLEDIVQMIMDATGHDKALAKATYKANAGRVGIVL